MPDETRTNVYKLFRATRVCPDSRIDPKLQLAFYDGGLGSRAQAEAIKITPFRRIYNLLSKATGLGITQNIIDCYAEIIRVWQPGDRIYLFGFSRGAYTVRCVGGVLKYCGVPTAVRVGGRVRPLQRDLQIRATHRHRSRQARLPARRLDQGRSPPPRAREARSQVPAQILLRRHQGLQHRALLHRRVGHHPDAGRRHARAPAAGLSLSGAVRERGAGLHNADRFAVLVAVPGPRRGSAARALCRGLLSLPGAGESGQISPGLLRHAAELRGALRTARARHR